MMQFYFLSIVLNVAVGFILFNKKNKLENGNTEILSIEDADDNSTEKVESAGTGKGQYFETQSFKFLIGALSFAVGFVKLFLVTKGIMILGDFIPAIAGMLGGATIFIGYFVGKSTVADNLNETFRKLFITNTTLIGAFCILAGVLHFFFYGLLFL